MLYLDLKVLHRKSSERTLRSVSHACLFWFSLALLFACGIWFFLGPSSAITFMTAYLLEGSLSVDNLFVFLLVFSFCKIPTKDQQRVLALGVLGALVFRLLFIFLGISLLQRFEWMYFVFGAILCVSAVAFIVQKNEQQDLSRSWIFSLAQKMFRLDLTEDKGHFWIRKEGKLYATKLFLALFLIESFDLVFAVDSVPAVLAVTSDLFLAYTSNVFAVLGLRSLYFLLEHLRNRFVHLKNGIALILFFVGIKLVLIPFFSVPSWLTFLWIAAALGISILWSFRFKNTKTPLE
jgi:tellurite resistance protein TerC